jgi:protein-disulfide isomerase
MKKLICFLFCGFFLSAFAFAQTGSTLPPAQLKIIQEASAPGIMLLGNADAKTTLVEFYDYLCPHCRHAQETILKIQAAHSNDLRLELIPVPLWRDSSFPFQVAALKVYHQDRAEFQKFHEALMATPIGQLPDLDNIIKNNISDPNLRANLLVGSSQDENALDQNSELLSKSGFSGVPAFVILNKDHSAIVFQGDYSNLPAAVDSAVARNNQ